MKRPIVEPFAPQRSSLDGRGTASSSSSFSSFGGAGGEVSD